MIVTLCGSARFEQWFKTWNLALTLAGHAVFALTRYPSDEGGVKCWYSAEEKLALDRAHKLKIESSDAILVLNPFAYIGESTLSEIDHARVLGKRLYALESWGKGYGITGVHFESVQNAARSFGLKLASERGWGSPIDTTSRSGFLDSTSPSLLGEGGPLRSSIVARIRSELRECSGSEEAW